MSAISWSVFLLFLGLGVIVKASNDYACLCKCTWSERNDTSVGIAIESYLLDKCDDDYGCPCPALKANCTLLDGLFINMCTHFYNPFAPPLLGDWRSDVDESCDPSQCCCFDGIVTFSRYPHNKTIFGFQVAVHGMCEGHVKVSKYISEFSPEVYKLDWFNSSYVILPSIYGVYFYLYQFPSNATDLCFLPSLECVRGPCIWPPMFIYFYVGLVAIQIFFLILFICLTYTSRVFASFPLQDERTCCTCTFAPKAPSLTKFSWIECCICCMPRTFQRRLVQRPGYVSTLKCFIKALMFTIMAMVGCLTLGYYYLTSHGYFGGSSSDALIIFVELAVFFGGGGFAFRQYYTSSRERYFVIAVYTTTLPCSKLEAEIYGDDHISVEDLLSSSDPTKLEKMNPKITFPILWLCLHDHQVEAILKKIPVDGHFECIVVNSCYSTLAKGQIETNHCVGMICFDVDFPVRDTEALLSSLKLFVAMAHWDKRHKKSWNVKEKVNKVREKLLGTDSKLLRGPFDLQEDDKPSVSKQKLYQSPCFYLFTGTTKENSSLISKRREFNEIEIVRICEDIDQLILGQEQKQEQESLIDTEIELKSQKK